MARATFQVDEAAHTPELYNAINSFEYDIPFYQRWSEKACGPVLELACGTGRITVPLARAGIDICGCDISDAMLAGLQERAAQSQIQIHIEKGDMRSFSIPQIFKLIFIPFNSLQCLYSIEDFENVFASVKRHLAPDGRFILTVFNPSIDLMYERRREIAHDELTLPDGRKIDWTETCNYLSAAQVNRVTWNFTYPDGKTERMILDMRCIYPQELDALLKYNGFVIEHKFGNFDEATFASHHASQIAVCKLAQ